ncbi:MFS transporter [Kaarinaea lacus]
MNYSISYSPNRPGVLITAIWINAVAPLWYSLLPLYIGALVDELGFDTDKVGWLASVELLGYAVASMSAFFWMRRASWRQMVVMASLAMLIANSLCMLWQSFATLLLLRFICGVTAGVLLAIAYSLLSDTNNPDRNFGFAISAQVSLGMIVILVLTWFISSISVTDFFLVFIFLALSVLPVVKKLPNEAVPHKTGLFPGRIFSLQAITILIAVGVFTLGQSAVWAFVERIGIAAELPQDFVGFTLALTLGISISGSLAAAWMADRWGHIVPFVLFIIVQGTALWLFTHPATKLLYFNASGLYQFIWSFVVPYFMAVLVSVDKSGRYTSLLVVAMAMGALFGPVLAGNYVVNDNYSGVLAIGAICTVLSVLLVAPYLRRRNTT